MFFVARDHFDGAKGFCASRRIDEAIGYSNNGHAEHTLTRRQLSSFKARGWRFFYRSFLLRMVVQPDNYKEDLACVATEPLTIEQIRNRAERGLLERCAYRVRSVLDP